MQSQTPVVLAPISTLKSKASILFSSFSSFSSSSRALCPYPVPSTLPSFSKVIFRSPISIFHVCLSNGCSPHPQFLLNSSSFLPLCSILSHISYRSKYTSSEWDKRILCKGKQAENAFIKGSYKRWISLETIKRHVRIRRCFWLWLSFKTYSSRMDVNLKFYKLQTYM